MSYKGQQHIIPCHEGGLVHFENSDILPSTAMVEGTKNIMTEGGGRKPRGGTIIKHSRGANAINGLFQFREAGGSHIISYDSAGVVKKNENDSIGTMAADRFPDFEIFDDQLYIVDGVNIPQLWNSEEASLTALADTKLPTDWAGTNQPSWIIKHGRGGAQELFVGGVRGKERFIYVGDGDDFSDDCVTQIVVNTGDGFGPVGAETFNGILWVLGKTKPFYIDTSNSDKALWFAIEAPWTGGVAHQRLIVRTPSDLVCMDDTGEIYSIVAVQESNDHKQASLTRPSGLHRWIQQNLNLNRIDKFFARYSTKTKSIIFFVIRGSGSSINAALVYNTQETADKAWMLYDNLSATCGYHSASAVEVKRPDGQYVLYGGGEDGNLWELEHTLIQDNGNPYYAGFFTPETAINELIRLNKNFDNIWLTNLAYGDFGPSIRVWVDGTEVASGLFKYLGALVPLGTFLLGTDKLGFPELLQKIFVLGFEGKRVKFEVYNENINEPFHITNLILDYTPLGRRLD